MLYSSKRTAPKRKKKIVILSPKMLGIAFILISLFLLLFGSGDDQQIASAPFSRFLLAPVSAIQSVRNFCVDLVGGLKSNLNAKDELAVIKEEVEQLRKENQELLYKLRRHDHYREAFNLPHEEGMPVIIGVVVMRPERMAQSLIINRGVDDGLSVNMPALSQEGLVGRTTRKLTRHRAEVMPITDPRSAVGVYIKGTPYEGILRGTEDGNNLLMTDRFLNTQGDETIVPKPGDIVYTSGHGAVFPRDIRAGVISDATSDKGIVVQPVVDINSVKAIMVLADNELRKEMLSLLDEQ